MIFPCQEKCYLHFVVQVDTDGLTYYPNTTITYSNSQQKIK